MLYTQRYTNCGCGRDRRPPRRSLADNDNDNAPEIKDNVSHCHSEGILKIYQPADNADAPHRTLGDKTTRSTPTKQL